MSAYDIFMRRAFELAQMGAGNVSPNPQVGCVIVKDGKIIGEGYHQKYGGPHAEVNAVRSVKKRDDLIGSQVIISLEPCVHHGLTPPCTDMLIDQKVGEVIVANIDPNPVVNGKGLKRLEEAGIKVTTMVLSDEGQWINRRFFTLIKKQRPYVILKWAQTSDGFIARDDHSSKWISGGYSRKLVHKWRHEEDAILVGTNTAKYDNPQLNVRDWGEGAATNQPKRVVIDRALKLDSGLKLFDGTQSTICFNSLICGEENGVTYKKLADDDQFLKNMLRELGLLKVQSIIVEGGAQLLNSFIGQNLWDEARIFTSPKQFGSGLKAPDIGGEEISQNQVVEDTLTILKNNH